VVGLKRECFKLWKLSPHASFFSRRVNCEPDALLTGHFGRPRQANLPGVVRRPPQSGWLDEWDRLKGGHLAVTC
jgi:hypothetical protein